MKVKLSASVICADLADLASQIKELEEAGVDMLHFDVMDGHFVPNLGLGPVVIEWVRKVTSLSFEAHLMIANPGKYIERFVAAGSQIVALHIETVDDFRRATGRLQMLGASPAVAINPQTPVDRIEPLLEVVSQVLVMTVQPGFAGQPLIRETLAKIGRVRDAIEKRRLNVDVAADGNVSFQNAPAMVSAGANLLVCGTSSIFSPGLTTSEGVRQLRAALARPPSSL
ncbi:MAG: ribulose-phosphate 3-epimerase [bacterium]|nr:ribulose-phosphate 3-epimerase [bacterium]